MKYRSRMDIISNILQSAMRGATKTRLMYSAYLSYSQLKEYLAFLQEKQLLAFDQETQLYRLTEKGLHYLNIYDEVRELFALDKTTPGAEASSPSLSENLMAVKEEEKD